MDYRAAAENIVKAFYGYCKADSKWDSDCFEDAKFCGIYHIEQMQKYSNLNPEQLSRTLEELRMLEFNEEDGYYDS